MSKLFTKIPVGWPLMKDAFLDFVSHSKGQKKIRMEFKEATGNDLKSLITKNGLEAMIDEATGYTEDILKQFIDWLIVNYWGEEGNENLAKLKL